MRMSRPSRMTAIAPSAIRRRSVFIEQPSTSRTSSRVSRRTGSAKLAGLVMGAGHTGFGENGLVTSGGAGEQADQRNKARVLAEGRAEGAALPSSHGCFNRPQTHSPSIPLATPTTSVGRTQPEDDANADESLGIISNCRLRQSNQCVNRLGPGLCLRRLTGSAQSGARFL